MFERVYERDGYYYYIPLSRRVYDTDLLEALADKLKEVNKKWKGNARTS